jgi:hypothetical protein
MRTLVALIMALSPVSASAQSNPSLDTSRGQRSGYQAYREIKPRFQSGIDDALYRTKDKAYQDALKSIPDSRKEADPWRDAR